jgi:hypothetical protein
MGGRRGYDIVNDLCDYEIDFNLRKVKKMLVKLYEVLAFGGFLLFLMVCNILMGKKIAELKKEFSSEVLWDGVWKGSTLAIFVVGSYAFALLPLFADLQIINPITGNEFSIAESIKWLLRLGIVAYFGLDLKKAYTLFKLPTNTEADEIMEPTAEEIKAAEAEGTAVV